MGFAEDMEKLKEFDCGQEKCVLTVYLDTDRSVKMQEQGAWKIKLKNGLKKLEEYLSASGNKKELNSYKILKEKISNEILGNQSRHMKSAVIFASEKESLWSVHYLQLPVETSFHWESKPILDQLKDLQKTYPRSGIILPNLDEIRIYDTFLGEIQGIDVFEFDLDTDNWKMNKGVASSERIASGAKHVDVYKSRLAANLNRFYKDVASDIEKLSNENKWENVYLIGENDLTNNLQSQLKININKTINKNLKNHSNEDVLAAVFE